MRQPLSSCLLYVSTVVKQGFYPRGAFTNYMDRKTYIHGWENVNESPLGIQTWSTICQRGQNFPFLNEVVTYESKSILFEKKGSSKLTTIRIQSRTMNFLLAVIFMKLKMTIGQKYCP